MESLKELMSLMDADERMELARLSGTSVSYLYQLAGGLRTPNVRLALDIEKASRQLASRTRGRLPIVDVKGWAA